MPHTWHDMSRIGILSRSRIFQSTCHIRGMTHLLGHICVQLVISIHMPHTWHDFKAALFLVDFPPISIHMPHTWHDDVIGRPNLSDESISIHMPHTWHDTEKERRKAYDVQFQSTCHIRGMTTMPKRGSAVHLKFQSTCHIRGMTTRQLNRIRTAEFQSTCHIRGMTVVLCLLRSRELISIHMPHTWHDVLSSSRKFLISYFNPHATYVA